MRTLLLGEALVDLICEQPAASIAEADAFRPRFGGMAANVAVAAARHGGDVALAGGAGDDAWGAWLRDRLAAEGVGLDWFELVEDEPTAIAFVTVDHDAEPSYHLYGDAIAAAMRAVAPRLDEALDACDGLFIGSNTLVGTDERELTLRARARALEQGKPVVFDPNLRLHRWRSTAEAIEQARGCVAGAMLVRANRIEGQLLTGKAEPADAAAALVELGARMAIVTRGPEGAVLRGEFEAEVPGVPAAAVSTVGAGDAFTGVVLARLTASGFYPPAVPAALGDAAEAAARATERWAAVA